LWGHRVTKPLTTCYFKIQLNRITENVLVGRKAVNVKKTKSKLEKRTT